MLHLCGKIPFCHFRDRGASHFILDAAGGVSLASRVCALQRGGHGAIDLISTLHKAMPLLFSLHFLLAARAGVPPRKFEEPPVGRACRPGRLPDGAFFQSLPDHGLFFVRIVCRPHHLSCPPVDKKRLFTRGTGWLAFAAGCRVFVTIQGLDTSGHVRGHGNAAQILTRLYLNFRDFDVFGVLPGILAVGGVAWAVRYGKKYVETGPFLEFGFFIAAYIVVLSIISPQSVRWGWFEKLADIRYMVVLIPLGAVCTGALLSIIHKKMRFFAFFLFCTIMCTNLLCLRFTDSQPRLLLPAMSMK